MFHSNDYPRQRMFRGLLEAKRSKVYGEQHPRSIRYPNVELSQTSQLSMDSYLRSQSASFTDVPLGQPSASTSSSSSAREQQLRVRCCYESNPSSSDFGTEHAGPKISLHQQSQSSLSNGSIRSSLRSKKKEKGKKTRFADTLESRARTNQKSYHTPHSSRSCGSQGGSQSGCRIPAHRPPRTMHTMHSGSSSSYQQFPEESYPLCSLENRALDRAIVLKDSEQRKRSPNQQKLSPSTPVLGRILSKIATPRKRMEIPYPPIKTQPSLFRQSEGRLLSDFASKQENNDAKIDSGRIPAIGCATKGSDCPKDLNKKKEQSEASNDVPSHSKQKFDQERKSETTESEDFHSQVQEERMEDFKAKLRKVMRDMEHEAKVNFQSVCQNITNVSESRLNEKAKVLQEEMKIEIDEKANAIQEATQSNLDLLRRNQNTAEKAIDTLLVSTTTKVKEAASVSIQSIQACTESGLAKLQKYTETWLANSCKAIANRLKPFLSLPTETTTATDGNSHCVGGQASDIGKDYSVSAIESTKSNRLKRKSSAALDESPKADQDDIIFSCSAKGEISLTQGSESSPSGQGISKSPVVPLRRSKRMKQWKKSTADVNVDAKNIELSQNMITPTNEKRKSGRLPPHSGQKESKTAKKTEGISPSAVEKSKKTLCVTPINGKNRSVKKKPKANPIANESKVEPKRLKPLRSKRRKRTKPQSLLTKKRSKTQYDSGSSRGSVPSEVFAFDDFQLSPLEGPDLIAVKSKREPKATQYGTRSSSEAFVLRGKKRRSTKPRSYGRRKRIIDMTDDDVFSF